jgi:hypothetical protein
MLCGLYGKSLWGESMTQEALAQLEQECPNLKNCNGACFQCEYFNVETGEMEYPVAQLEQEHDNSATHLAHCYQGEYPVCKYGDENCPAIPKVKAQPEQEPVGCAECERLKDALKRANGLAEHFERAWYLRGDEIEQLNAQPEQEPVAWRVWNPDGDKQYLYSENGDGEPLYTKEKNNG